MTNRQVSLRYADARTATLHPEGVSGPLVWSCSNGLWQARVNLGPIAAGSILAPSLSLLDNWPYDFSFELTDGGDRWPLPKVPSPEQSSAPVGTSQHVRGMLDCWHVDRALQQAQLLISCAAAVAPVRYLATLTGRPLELPQLPAPPSACHRTTQPPQMSQMLENPRIAGRICSPVSLAMVLALRQRENPLHRLLPLCRDPATNMYGLWPLAIRAASRFGFLGAVELLSDWDPVIHSLNAGMPVVASIRFPANGLSGSPMNSTAGHLVVVYGVDATHVLVNDPAAPIHGTVSRRYPIEQFSQAWFRHRGAAYILLP